MTFGPLTHHLRRLAGGRARVPGGVAGDLRLRRKWRLNVAAAAGIATSALIMIFAAAWWLTEPEASGDARSVVVLDVPPRGGSTGSSDAAGNSESRISNVAGARAGEDGALGEAPGAAEPHLMVPAPKPDLVEQGPYGPLPKVASDGRKPWQVYARPSDAADTRPRIAIVITDIGLSTAASQEAIRRLPPAVTLSVDPYAAEPDEWAPKARKAGHEILLSLPVESAEFPFRDPGPMALLTSLTVEDNIDRLQHILSCCTGYVGVSIAFGGRFEQDDGSLRPILAFIARRGLMYVGGIKPRATPVPGFADAADFPRITVDVWIDDEATPHGIDRALAQLEATARERAVAVGLARNYPLTIARLATWAALLEEKDIALVPISAIAGRQLLP